MNQKEVYRKFLLDALLTEQVPVRKVLHQLRQLQREEFVIPPKSAEEALSEWYERTGNIRSSMISEKTDSKVPFRFIFGSAALVACCLLIIWIIKPLERFGFSHKSASDNGAFYENEMAGQFTDEGMDEEAADAAEPIEEAAPEDAEEDVEMETEGGAIITEEALEDDNKTADTAPDLYDLLLEQYKNGETLRFSCMALNEQTEEGHLLLEQDIRIVLDANQDPGEWAGKMIEVTCKAGAYEIHDHMITTERGALSITEE